MIKVGLMVLGSWSLLFLLLWHHYSLFLILGFGFFINMVNLLSLLIFLIKL